MRSPDWFSDWHVLGRVLLDGLLHIHNHIHNRRAYHRTDHVPCVNIYIFSHIPLYAGRNSALGGGNSAPAQLFAAGEQLPLKLSGHVTSRARLCWWNLCCYQNFFGSKKFWALEVEVCAHRIKCAIYGTGWLFRVFFSFLVFLQSIFMVLMQVHTYDKKVN